MSLDFGSAVERLGFLRVPGHGRLHREWLHFVIHDDDVDLVLNFSVLESPAGRTTGNVLLLVRGSDGEWDGDLDRVPPSRLHAVRGRLDLELGRASLRFDGSFHIQASCARRAVTVDLVLEPIATPYLVHNASNVQWLVAPCWRATGELFAHGSTRHIAGAPAYHDHNWGDFEGGNVGWRWVCSLAPKGWNVVFVQLLDRTRTNALSQGLLLWSDAHRERVFRGGEVLCAAEGLLRKTGPILSVPRALAVLAMGTASDVPSRLRISAAEGEDRLAGAFASHDVARVLVPRDMDLGVTVIHEIKGRICLEGIVGGRDVRIDAPAFGEVLGWLT
ncbi:MAG: hypothetical protein KF764_01855 [Labilithrix sp.]|nr:hypothetical protein [Labilithrix sp.]